MRYFEIAGKPCRGLAFDKQLLGSNKEKLLAHNVFVKVPRNILHEDLHKIFEQFGPIKSLKVSLTHEYESNGYGFICFEEAESAPKALAASEANKLPPGVQAFMFKPRDNKSSMRKLINNIYVKNLPTTMSDELIRKLFDPFGTIKSMFLKESQFGKFGFVCYDDPEGKSKEYGPACAAKAIEALNEKEIEGNKLVVRCALSKMERDAEKKRETIRYKTSKKRCNLFVKNFPQQWKKEQIEKMFSQFGEIEKVRLDQGKSGNAFAFVCFKEPNDAAKAKQNLHNHNVDGKTLNICYYEIKEIR
jgi:polyadenylate-binding protein